MKLSVELISRYMLTIASE